MRVFFHTDIYHVIQWFIIYSFMGWLVESIYMSICNRKWTNRGFVFSPFCPIYAFGALIVYFLLRHFENNYLLIYLIGCLIATGFEFLTAMIMKTFFGEVWWDYNDKPFNYKGILCLESSIAWGFYSVFLFAFLQKFVNYISNLYPYRAGILFAKIVFGIYFIDFLIHVYLAKRESFEPKMTKLKETIRMIRS